MPKYAQETKVSADKTRAEIERVLQRYGATGFIYGWDDGDGKTSTGAAMVAFRMHGRMIRFHLPMPAVKDFRYSPSGRYRDDGPTKAAWEQGCRQRWRALALCIKAKLEAVDSGISEFEDEFLAHIVLPDGRTAGQFLRPQIATAYDTGTMPKLLPCSREVD